MLALTSHVLLYLHSALNILYLLKETEPLRINVCSCDIYYGCYGRKFYMYFGLFSSIKISNKTPRKQFVAC